MQGDMSMELLSSTIFFSADWTAFLATTAQDVKKRK